MIRNSNSASQTGEFDAPLTYEGKKYNVHFSEIYYELIAKYSASDPKAWNGADYDPYLVNVHIKGTTSPELQGEKIGFLLHDMYACQLFSYDAIVNQDGSFVCDFVQGQGDNHNAWYAPKTLFYSRAYVI